MSGTHDTALAESRAERRRREEDQRLRAAELIEEKRAEERRFIDGFAALLLQRRDITESMAELTTEAEEKGHSPKAMKVIARRLLETADERIGREALEGEVDRLTVEHGFDATPLGRAAADAGR